MDFVCDSYSRSEHLKAVPESLESLMVEKHLYQAVSLLVQSAKQINTQEMLDIGAMADLRIYFTSQENVSFIHE